MIKAVGFDVGHTLIEYHNSLNWSSLYRAALQQVISTCGLEYSVGRIDRAADILTKYNTRVNPREVEVPADVIFGEILNAWHQDATILRQAKESYFSFFQSGAAPYPEVEAVLSELKAASIKTGIFTNVAYGMDNCYSLRDIDSISEYIDVKVTSIDAGFRKPNSAGYIMLLEAFGIKPAEMLFVGDEDVDIIGANRLGIGSVLINRSDRERDCGQKYTINSLNGIMDILY